MHGCSSVYAPRRGRGYHKRLKRAVDDALRSRIDVVPLRPLSSVQTFSSREFGRPKLARIA